MEGERIKLVKVTMEFVIKNLESNDRFGYSSRVIIELTKMDAEGKKKALSAVERIKADGSTALCDGLLAGIRMMRNRTTSNDVSSVMLFTDGQANIVSFFGPTSAQQIIQAVRGGNDYKVGGGNDRNNISYSNANVARAQGVPQYNQINNLQQQTQGIQQIQGLQQTQNLQQIQGLQQTNFQVPIQQLPQLQQQQQQPGSLVIGEEDIVLDEKEEDKTTKEGEKSELPCTINTFGFGEGHNEGLLQAIAEFGRGMYAFIKTTDMISDTFAECLGGLVSVVGQEVVLRVETLSDVKINKCLSLGLNLNVVRPNQRYDVTFSDIQSEENRDVIFQLAVPAILEPKADWPLAQIVCSYKNVILGKTDQLSTIASITRVESTETGERSYALDLQNNRIVAAEAMVDADQLANQGKLKEARERLDNAQEHIKNSRTNQDKYSSGLIQDIQQCASGLRNETEYRNHGGKALKMNYQSHNVQRAVQTSAFVSQEQYTNNSRNMMKSKFKPK
ncbi:hypothetical protein RFI_06533 [Reticulomyxa filosa]|uniref:CPSF6/7 RSLD domain-containing protein n=1 Tax=Reticulomyxa filosa TaxID=46433 RepID=X6NZ80_RETFI|nr:hypothetical protein RFI_06533 [Reticulomyxa filosa]|eukprot:ETO30587.1 hypothetical protein RFI_06533 [Reticulomyxa filosa]